MAKAEIYKVRSGESDFKMLDNSLLSAVERINSYDVSVLYTTEIDNKGNKLIEALESTFNSEEYIDTIIVANALDSKGKNPLYDTMCKMAGIPSGKNDKKNEKADEKAEKNAEKKAKRKKQTLYVNAVKINSIGNSEAYCFFYEGRKVVLLPKISQTGLTFEDILEIVVPVIDAERPIPEKKLESKGLLYIAQPEKKGFLRSVFPWKGDSAGEKTRKIILLTAILVFLVAAGFLIKTLYVEPKANEQTNTEIKNSFTEDATEEVTLPNGTKETRQVRNWDKLLAQNSDLVGWMEIEGTKLDYPVVQSDKDTKDSQHYLYRDFNQNNSLYGTVFVDYRSNKGADSKNVIMHGHHMNDGSMFAAIMGYGKYTGDVDFYNEHPIVKFDTPDGDGYYKVISVYKTNVLDAHGEYFDYLRGSFGSDAEFMNYIYHIRERSLIDTPVTVNEDDQIITLSTCSYEYSDFRTVVVARKVRDGESLEVNKDEVSVNSDALWPDVYYSNHGGTRPKITSFKRALKDGDINWYDGKGNLKGEEPNFTLDENTTSSTESGGVVKDTSISFTEKNITMALGEVTTLFVDFSPADTTDTTIAEWVWGNQNVLKVEAGGVVTAVGVGTTDVVATSANGNKATCTITVIEKLDSLNVEPNGKVVQVGDTVELTAVVSPANATSGLKWSSSDTNLAKVNQKGVVTVLGAGTATIKVESSDGRWATCVLTIENKQ